MQDKIIKIEELNGYKMDDEDCGSYEGYLIETECRKLYVLVSDDSNCCESFGHIASVDNVNDFIGAEIKSVRFVANDSFDDCEILKNEIGGSEAHECAFISLETTMGLLQFAVYNVHNGYYGHDVRAFEIFKTFLEGVLPLV